MRHIATTILACALLCAGAFAHAQTDLYGKFVLSDPAPAAAPELSMRWQFGLTLNIDPQEIDSIKFSCGQFPGSTFTVKFSDMQRKNGGYYADGPITPVSSKSTPWLFDPTFTLATCNATIHSIWNTVYVISTRLNYTEDQKTATLQKLKSAHESSAQAKKR